jgi:hypothetical protein
MKLHKLFIFYFIFLFSISLTFALNVDIPLPTNYSEVNTNHSATSDYATTCGTTDCWTTAEGVKCDVADITYDEISGGDVNALGYTGTFSFLSGNVGGIDMTGDPWWLSGTDLELEKELTVNGYSHLNNTYPLATLIYDLGSGANRWRWLYVQNISFENADGYNLHLSDNLTVDETINANHINATSMNVTNMTIKNMWIINMIASGNITADWFFGKYNWTTGDDWNSFDGSILTFNSSKLSTTFYNASSILVVTGTGAGNLVDIQTYNSISYNVSEVSSDFELRVNFTDVDDFNQIIIRYRDDEDDEPHTTAIQLYDYEEEIWEDYGVLPRGNVYHIVEFGVFDADEHIEDGVVQLRFYQNEGVPPRTHLHEFDWVTISKGFGTPSGEEVDPIWNSEKGNYVPYIGATSDVDLGNQNLTAKVTNATKFTASSGSAKSPSYSFSGDTDTGFYSDGSSLYLSVSGKKFAYMVDGGSGIGNQFNLYKGEDANVPPTLRFYKSRNTTETPVKVNSGDVLGNVIALGYDGTDYGVASEIRSLATQTWTTSAHGSSLNFLTTRNGATADEGRFYIDESANVYFSDVYDTALGGEEQRDLYIQDDGQVGYLSSSEDTKENIHPALNTNWIYDLNIVDFNYIDSVKNQTGMIAEEVDLIKPEIVSYKRAYDLECETIYEKSINPITNLTEILNMTSCKKVNITKTDTPETVNYNNPIVISSLIKELQNLKIKNDNQQIKIDRFTTCLNSSVDFKEYKLCMGL